MQRLQERFGARNTNQEPKESMEDWSHRVFMLSTLAFSELPSAYTTEQAVSNFCQRLANAQAHNGISLH
ncbi:hypothetical protein DPMN_024120 [Dreissena polymorpha]|uniref:Uncharacterized protein n=1 Tax=Dreissena polymorpha TaxID=45954 RepID=A0A9D4RBB4_DREPO|nr:hypothetical protein DPMN_024120 [Dreissena polymorpha]